jgi:hypothetical protein
MIGKVFAKSNFIHIECRQFGRCVFGYWETGVRHVLVICRVSKCLKKSFIQIAAQRNEKYKNLQLLFFDLIQFK